MRMVDLILKKRSGLEHSFSELRFIADGSARGFIPDYQLSAWLMAVFFRGLSGRETADWTKAMVLSGRRLNLSSINAPKIDKHSTGGVGDGISLALAPIVASQGIAVPMMSGRGLGHTGGTLDKLESIKGFRVQLSPHHIIRQIKSIGVCMFGQTKELAPADRKLYALRDVTSTVESLPLIVSSILSKKYAEDLNGLVLDVKYGSGAFLKDFKTSRDLACTLIETAKFLKMKCVAVLTCMEEPLGFAIGNAVEMEQAIKILHGEKSPGDFMEALEVLSGWMIYIGQKARTPEEGREKAVKSITSKSALNKLRQMIKWQGGDGRVVDCPDRFLTKSKFVVEIKAGSTGYIQRLDAKTAGVSGVLLGAGRSRAEDSVDFGAGIILEKKTGDFVRQGSVIANLYSSDHKKLMEAKQLFVTAFEISKDRVGRKSIIKEILK